MVQDLALIEPQLRDYETRLEAVEDNFPKNSLVDVLEGHVHKRSPSYDVVMAPGGSVARAFTRGAKSVLILNGTHTVDANFTVPADGTLVGESRDGAILSMGAYQVTGAQGSYMGMFAAKDGTHATASVQTLGLIDYVLFDNCVRSLRLGSGGQSRDCQWQNYAGTPASGDAYLHFGSLVVAPAVRNPYFLKGPAIRQDGTLLYATIQGGIIFMPDAPTVPSIELGVGPTTTGLIIGGGLMLLSADTGSHGASAGHIRIGSGASGVSIDRCFVARIGSPTDNVPFAVRNESDSAQIKALLSAPDSSSGVVDLVRLEADDCQLGDFNVKGMGSGTGVLVNGNYDDNQISGHRLQNFDRGIDIASALAEDNRVTDNNLKDNVTAGFRDLGTRTRKRDNIE